MPDGAPRSVTIRESSELTPELQALFSIPQAVLEEKRRKFEKPDDTAEQARARLRKLVGARPRSLKDQFLTFLREEADGSIRLAWRRHFDSDGDGELDFREFANALFNLRYQGDVVELWKELGGSASGSLTLHSMDAVGAEILDYVSIWCARTLGGPIEVFEAIDDDGSDTLTVDEFLEGLCKLGFFDCDDVPTSICSVELARENLYPLLDQDGQGAISPDEVLFLEKDKAKRERLKVHLLRVREVGHEGAMKPLPREAERLLRSSRLSHEEWCERLPTHKLRRPASAPSVGRSRTAPASFARSAPVSPKSFKRGDPIRSQAHIQRLRSQPCVSGKQHRPRSATAPQTPFRPHAQERLRFAPVSTEPSSPASPCKLSPKTMDGERRQRPQSVLPTIVS